MKNRELQQEIMRLRTEQRINQIRMRRQEMEKRHEVSLEKQKLAQEQKCKEAQMQRQALEDRKEGRMLETYQK